MTPWRWRGPHQPPAGAREALAVPVEAVIESWLGGQAMDIAFAVLVANVAITRYFDGELSPANRQRVEERLHTDPALRACLELRTKKRNSTAPDGDGDIFSDAAFDTEKLLVHLALKREGIRVPAIATHPRLCASLIVESERR